MTTRATLKTRIYRRLEDPAKTHWSEDEINDLINDSRMDLWQYAKSKNQSVLPMSNGTFTWEANTRFYSLVTKLGHNDFDICLVSMTANLSAVDANNPPVPLPRIPYEEINRSGVIKPMYHLNHYQGRSPESVANTWNPGGNAGVYAFALQGQDLYLSPTPATDVQLYIEYMTPYDALSSDSDEIFPTLYAAFRPWETLVELGAVLAAKGRSDEQSNPVMSQWQYKMELFSRWLEQREITGTPRIMLNGY